MASFCAKTIARGLCRARTAVAPVAPVDVSLPTSIPNAYLVQNEMRALMAEGEIAKTKINPMGWKIGATNDGARKALGLEAPFYGSIFHHYTAFDVAVQTCKFEEFITSRVNEPELALRIGKNLPADKPATAADISAAVSHVATAIEVVDSAVSGPRAGSQVIADNAGHGRWIVGKPLEYKEGMFDPEAIKLWLRVNGKVERESTGGFVEGGAFTATAWLANTLRENGHSLKAGDWITTGTAAAPYPAVKGDLVEVEFEGLGKTAVKFE